VPVHIGVMCETCRKVLFVGTWRGITPSERDAGLLKLTCKPPCPAVRELGKTNCARIASQMTSSEEGMQKRASMSRLQKAKGQAHITDIRAESQ
jgi:hypothetical protein